MVSVTACENFSRSTASACPAGTAVCAAICISNEPARRISSFSSHGAVFSVSDFSEFEHTNSANCAVWCAGVERTGRISYNSTGTPRRAHCHAASDPASPAPIMRMFLGMSPTGGRNCRYYTVGLGGGRHGKSFVRRTGNSHPEVRDIYEKTLRGKPGSVYKL